MRSWHAGLRVEESTMIMITFIIINSIQVVASIACPLALGAVTAFDDGAGSGKQGIAGRRGGRPSNCSRCLPSFCQERRPRAS
jgi:hypothetical protein